MEKDEIKKMELAKIEKKINRKIRKENFRKELFENPIVTLKKEGIELSADKEKELVKFMENLTIPPQAAITAKIDEKMWGIGISIDWDLNPEDIIIEEELRK